MTAERLVKLRFALEKDSDGYPPGAIESLWVEPRDSEVYCVRSIPFFYRKATLGDVIRVVSEVDGIVDVIKIVESSGNSMVRIYCDTPEKLQSALEHLKSANLAIELFSKFSLISIIVRKTSEYRSLRKWLKSFASDGEADYEEPLLRH